MKFNQQYNGDYCDKVDFKELSLVIRNRVPLLGCTMFMKMFTDV